MTKHLLFVVALGLSLSATSSASARVPTFSGTSIVTGTSIGGLKVGVSKAKAIAAWGKPDRCLPADQYGTAKCQYDAVSSPSNVKQMFAGFSLRKGKVIVITLESAENKAVDAKVKRLKTTKKIRIGSKLADARRLYGIPAPAGGEAALSTALFKQGKRCTTFFAATAPFVISAINVGLCSTNHGLDGGLS